MRTDTDTCAGQCGMRMPVSAMETVGRLRYCAGDARWERRYVAREAELADQERVRARDAMVASYAARGAERCLPGCMPCAAGVARGELLQRDGRWWAHRTDAPRMPVDVAALVAKSAAA